MEIIIRKFDSGWVGVSISMTTENIDQFVGKLLALREGQIDHFHVRTNDFDREPSVGDIEFSLTKELNDAFSVE